MCVAVGVRVMTCLHVWVKIDGEPRYRCQGCKALGYARAFGHYGRLGGKGRIVAYRCSKEGCSRDAVCVRWAGMAERLWCEEHGR